MSQSRNPSSSGDLHLVTNAYELSLFKPDALVFEYKLDISLSQNCKDQAIQVLNRNFVSRSLRHLIMNLLVTELGVPTDALVGDVIIESNMKFLYCLSPLADPKLNPAYQFKDILVDTDLLTQLQVDITIGFSRGIPMGSSSILAQAVLTSALHHKPLLDMIRYGPTYYSSSDSTRAGPHQQERRLDLISEHVMGISLSGVRRSTAEQTLVVINCPQANLTGSHKLLDLLLSFIIGHPVDNLDDLSRYNFEREHSSTIAGIKGDEDWFLTFCSILNGFKCQTLHSLISTNIRFNLTQQSAQDLIVIDPRNRQEISVLQFYQRSNSFIKYPNLPCLKSRSKSHPYHPFEMCVLKSGQKVPIFRLSGAAHQRLTALNKPKPDAYWLSSCNARDQVEFINRDQFRSFGIHLSRTPVDAKGSKLCKPILQFKNHSLEPQKDFWESKAFCRSEHLVEDWCVVNTVPVDLRQEEAFFYSFCQYFKGHQFNMSRPTIINRSKQTILEAENAIQQLIVDCRAITKRDLRFIMFVIDSSSTSLNRLIHISFDDHPHVTATCLRVESIMNTRQHKSIFRTLAHKVNARLGGINVTYDDQTLAKLNLCKEELMIVGLDVTHPDNELNGVSIVGCAYTCTKDLFKHRSLVWPQAARMEIICRMDVLMRRIIGEYHDHNNGRLPRQIIVYRDGVSHEEFERVRNIEVMKVQSVLDEFAHTTDSMKPSLSYIIAQKRHSLRFFDMSSNNGARNPPGGTLIDKDIVQNGREFYLYSNTSAQATSRPLHYHVLVDGLGLENLQKLTYFLCFNFGKCSGTLSMPSSLRYAHNAAYDARNRVIGAREFSENKFYSNKFFC